MRDDNLPDVVEILWEGRNLTRTEMAQRVVDGDLPAHRRRTRKVTGCVYVVATEIAGRVFCKVGKSESSASNRRSSLQVGCPFKLELVYESDTIEQPAAHESVVHSRLDDCRHRGEWFEVDIDTAVETVKEVCGA